LETATSRFQRGIETWSTAHPSVAPYRETTLLDALRLDVAAGTDDVDRSARRLLRAAAAAWLNAAYETLEFPYRRYRTGENANPSLASLLQPALASGDPAAMDEVAVTFEAANALGCPLD
jgi:hypothetical protein